MRPHVCNSIFLKGYYLLRLVTVIQSDLRTPVWHVGSIWRQKGAAVTLDTRRVLSGHTGVPAWIHWIVAYESI